MTFASALRAAREQRRMTQGDLAAAAGLDQTTISHMEAGRRRPGTGNLRKLALALNVSADVLLEIGLGTADPLAYAVTVNGSTGGPIAWFVYQDQAGRWIQANYPGRAMIAMTPVPTRAVADAITADTPLPSDARLPSGGTIGKGCPLSLLLAAMRDQPRPCFEDLPPFQVDEQMMERALRAHQGLPPGADCAHSTDIYTAMIRALGAALDYLRARGGR